MAPSRACHIRPLFDGAFELKKPRWIDGQACVWSGH